MSIYNVLYKTFTIKRPCGEKSLLIAGTSSCRKTYRTFSTLKLSKDTQLYLPNALFTYAFISPRV